ncbi:M50 family metallopeptidase [Candidatus Woesearchaeota archaeon]|nr:M50 family metallopeptidase [Candidatus Woesearchaeota archaeon]
MFIPGQAIALVTFPGVIFHELGHAVFCRLTGLKVKEVCYFSTVDFSGYVIHEKVKNYTQSFLITAGPSILGTIASLASYLLARFTRFGPFVNLLFVWIGISAAMHSFPSDSDGKNLWKDTKIQVKNGNLFAYLGYPFTFIIFASNMLRRLWFDLLYALFLLSLVFPELYLALIGGVR